MTDRFKKPEIEYYAVFLTDIDRNVVAQAQFGDRESYCASLQNARTALAEDRVSLIDFGLFAYEVLQMRLEQHFLESVFNSWFY